MDGEFPKWTKEDSKRLSEYKYVVEDDNIKVKEKIKEKLIENRDIIHVLNNKELEDSEATPDEYVGVNILPYYLISPTQTKTENFICFTAGYRDLNRYNKTVKYLHITFVILCETSNIIDKDTGISRHDLLGALVKHEFNYTNYFGRKIEVVSDEETVVDTKYNCRTIVFEQITDNNVAKSSNGMSKIINKEIHT